MKKNRDKEERSCRSADNLPQKSPGGNIPVFLFLAVLVLVAAVLSNSQRFFHNNVPAALHAVEEKYVWLTGSSVMEDGLYLFTPEQLKDDFPEIGDLLIEDADREFDHPVYAINYHGDVPQLEPLPPAVANIFLQPISINRADTNILTALPGIGPALAARIVQRRQQHGPFRSKEELLQVTGIGPKKFAGLVDHITLD
jgi:competence ComEA-like helix-hairpin-helix protein